MKRSFLVLGLSVFAVFGSGVAGFPGSGGLCTLVLAFMAGLGWGTEKVITYVYNICYTYTPDCAYLFSALFALAYSGSMKKWISYTYIYYIKNGVGGVAV